MVMAVVPVHVVMLLPAVATGCVPHVIVIEELVLVPIHAPVPVTLSVAVNDPDETLGVKVANAGFAFCDHVPDPLPPLHVGVPL
jgi:hypothetical protein